MPGLGPKLALSSLVITSDQCEESPLRPPPPAALSSDAALFAVARELTAVSSITRGRIKVRCFLMT